MSLIAGIVIGFAGGILLFVVIASRHSLSDWRSSALGEETAPKFPTSGASWEELTARAGRMVDAAQAELPDDVRTEAERVPTLFEEWHPTRRRVLGVYHNVNRTDLATRKGPIVLYLRAIDEWSRLAGVPFDEQVRLTYLHELGHHVGWNEGQVQERGL